MKRIEILNKASEFRHKLGDINRQLAFAGIAIVWIFKVRNVNEYNLDGELIKAVKFIVISLGLDLLHYIWLSALYISVHWYQDVIKRKGPNEDVQFNNIIPRISDGLIIAKVVCNIIGFCFILCFLLKAIKAV